jgi:hypothetical protein
MNYDRARATSTAKFAVSEVSRLLESALAHQQEFSVDIKGGLVEGEAIAGFSNSRLDGSCEIRISIKPLPVVQTNG